MTALSLFGGDWTYEFEDEFVAGGTNRAGTRMLRYVSGPIRTSLALYSELAANADEFQAMGFKNPMLPVTPNQFTLESKAFISRASTEWLQEGTLIGDWTLVGVAGNNSGRGVLRVPYSGGTGPAPGDIGREVIQGGLDAGTLLDYEVEPDGTTIAWIRPSDSTPVTGDLFDGTGALVATGGTMSTTSSTAATNGQTTYTAIQAIGSVPTATEVYIVQNRIKLGDSVSNANFQFWATDPNVSLGIISVLIRTQVAGATIADADLEVFARKYGSLYDNFRLNVGAGGFSALPLASAVDINNTTGYRRNVMTGSSGTWTVGNALYVGGTFATATMKGIITAESGGTIEYYLIGDLTDLTGSESIKEYDFVAEADGDATATGAVGGSIANLLGPTDSASGEGGTVTITLGHTTRDHDNTGTAEPYSVIVDAQSNVPIAKVYERIKYVTRRGGGAADLFGAGVNVDGEQYRGMEATIYTNTHSVSFTEGDDLTQTTGGSWTARLMADNQAGTGEGVPGSYITVTDQQTSLESLVDGDVIDDEAADQVTVDTTPNAIVAHASVKASPFGSFTGSQIFGAPGIDFRNPGAGDAQSYILTDNLGTLRTPPNTITYTVANTRAGDRIQVARDTGTAGVIDKDKFGGMTAVAISAKAIVTGSAIEAQTPTAGYIRVVENALQQEHKYFYDDWTGSTFNLTDITAASATAGTSDTALSKTGGPSFITEGVQVGMLVYVAGRTSTYEVVSVDGADDLTIRLLYGAGGFVTTDTYTINETIQLYAVSDDIFDLIIDAEEDTGTDVSPGSISNTLVKTPAANFGTVVQVRLGKTILPFEQNQTQGDGDTTVTAVRTPDTIAV